RSQQRTTSLSDSHPLHDALQIWLTPLSPSDRVAACFPLAWDIRILDMRAAPYDFTGVRLDPTGEEWTPVPIETAEGKAEYVAAQDRKSTRLNSGHVKISYAVFCL